MDIIENGVERKLFAEVEEVYGEHLCTERLDTPGFIKATNYHQDINELGFESIRINCGLLIVDLC